MTKLTKQDQIAYWHDTAFGYKRQRDELLCKLQDADVTRAADLADDVRHDYNKGPLYCSIHDKAEELLVRQRNDELLAALRDLSEQVEQYADADDCDLPDTSDARRAIAKVEK